jgi:hypothetical protein
VPLDAGITASCESTRKASKPTQKEHIGAVALPLPYHHPYLQETNLEVDSIDNVMCGIQKHHSCRRQR